MIDKLSYVHEMQESANQQVTGQVARNVISTEVISSEARVMSPEILIKSVCNISRSSSGIMV